MGNPSTKVWILGILFLAAFIIGGSLLYVKVIKKPASPVITTPPLQETTLTQGVKKVQEMFATYPQFVKKVFIQEQIEGTLKTTTGKTLTIETGGKTLTLTNDIDISKIRYTKLAKTATSSSIPAAPVEIKPGEVKTGDLILINQTIDWQTGQATIVGITVLPPR